MRTNDTDKICRLTSRTCRAFTLIEAVASIALLAMIISFILQAYHPAVDNVTRQMVRERGMAVCQRHMEHLLATLQEPNSLNLPEQDVTDPQFTWELDLERITINDVPPNRQYTNTVIVVTLTARSLHEEFSDEEPIQLVRYLPWNGLKPLPGRPLAVPYTHEYEEPDWFKELKKQNDGKDPTLEQMIKYLFPDMDMEEQMEQMDDETENEDNNEITVNPSMFLRTK